MTAEELEALRKIRDKPIVLHNGLPPPGSPPMRILATLQEKRLIKLHNGGRDRLVITMAGLALVGKPDPPP